MENLKEIKNRTMNNIRLLHLKCCFVNFAIVTVELKNKKKFPHGKK